jgi:hypothetical protein
LFVGRRALRHASRADKADEQVLITLEFYRNCAG